MAVWKRSYPISWRVHARNSLPWGYEEMVKMMLAKWVLSSGCKLIWMPFLIKDSITMLAQSRHQSLVLPWGDSSRKCIVFELGWILSTFANCNEGVYSASFCHFARGHDTWQYWANGMVSKALPTTSHNQMPDGVNLYKDLWVQSSVKLANTSTSGRRMFCAQYHGSQLIEKMALTCKQAEEWGRSVSTWYRAWLMTSLCQGNWLKYSPPALRFLQSCRSSSYS